MKLNHLDLQVADVQRSVLFFEQFFGLTLQTNRNSPAVAVLSDGHGFTFVLQRKKNPAETYPEGFHLGFIVDDVETVLQVHARLKAAGFDVSDIQEGNRGVLAYCRTPDGYLVEVNCRRKPISSRKPGGDSL